MAPRVSINLCCYNSERYLEETLRSILAQTYKDWELVIVDDGSADQTEAIVKRYMGRGWPFLYHVQAHAGLARARNQALQLSQGELVAFIDHDDLWEPHKLERQVPLFDRNPRVGLVFSDCINFREDGKAYRHFLRLPPAAGNAYRELLKAYFLNLQTVVIRRSALKGQQEWFDPRFVVAEEADLFLRIARRWELDYVDEPLARWRIHSGSTTQVHSDRFPIEMRMIFEKQKQLDPEWERRFRKEAAQFKLQIVRAEARTAWRRNLKEKALEILRPYRFRHLAAAGDSFLMQWLPYSLYERFFFRQDFKAMR